MENDSSDAKGETNVFLLILLLSGEGSVSDSRRKRGREGRMEKLRERK